MNDSAIDQILAELEEIDEVLHQLQACIENFSGSVPEHEDMVEILNDLELEKADRCLQIAVETDEGV